MSLPCKIGWHSWDGCQCVVCGKTRDKSHDWSQDCEVCNKCGKTSGFYHIWSLNCEKCAMCGKTRMDNHNWSDDCEKCSKCGIKRTGRHQWEGCKCSICGKTKNDSDLIHIWNSDHLCSVCKALAPPWISRIINGFLSLKITAVPQGSFTNHSFESAINFVIHQVTDYYIKYSKPVQSFKFGDSIYNQSRDSFYKVSLRDHSLEMGFHPGYSEYSFSVSRHGANEYSVYSYEYYAGNDDGGKSRYL